jgi:rhodanese-related sulfurtransferase
MPSLPIRTYLDIRAALLAGDEIALLDVREEDPHAEAHPLFAANLPFSQIEIDASRRLPRPAVPIVVLDAGEGLAEKAARRLLSLGYTNVALLDGGLDGWRRAGGELFRDVNVPSKAFGEWVESKRHTPSLSADEVDALLRANGDVVVLDARRFDEYQTMNIPGSTSVPGGELVLRARALAPNPATRIIVNCAGRTRSIIGTQSLVNAGLPNRIAALRNGTIGWTLAGKKLHHGSARTFDSNAGLEAYNVDVSRVAARNLAGKAGVHRTHFAEAARWLAASDRTTYGFDVRTPREYETARAKGFLNAPGGQLVQETEMFAPVRGARIVLLDTDGVRANMTASWLAQMNHQVYVVDDLSPSDLTESSPARTLPPDAGATSFITPAQLAEDLGTDRGATIVLDVGSSAQYVKQHVPGAHWVLRSRFEADVRALLAKSLTGNREIRQIVLTCDTAALAVHAAPDLAAITGKPVRVLQGGTAAWIAQKFLIEIGETHLLSPRIDRYRRPYEGTQAPVEAMNAYLEWEFGLVEQLKRDGTHGFSVI